ncbi:hypothetical protein QOZ80_9BG0717160 [Eleusine coracana subsp. coracana]|nr:hypothetical protein QOZ80_9BG0717160 [Eleusine coracana subsp. coracana]
MAAADRLSDLPDDLLRRVLRFTPAKESASTAVLSRRWRWLWCTSDTVNLDSRSYGPSLGDAKRNAFFNGAMAALAAHRRPVTKRLSFHVESDNDYHISKCGHDWSKPDDDLSIGDVTSNPATRHI